MCKIARFGLALKKMSNLARIWLVIAVLYLGLAGFHTQHAFEEMPLLPPRTVGTIMGVPFTTKETVADINNFIARFNDINKWTNIAQIAGYLIASGLAFWSLNLSVMERAQPRKGGSSRHRTTRRTIKR